MCPALRTGVPCRDVAGHRLAHQGLAALLGGLVLGLLRPFCLLGAERALCVQGARCSGCWRTHASALQMPMYNNCLRRLYSSPTMTGCTCCAQQHPTPAAPSAHAAPDARCTSRSSGTVHRRCQVLRAQAQGTLHVNSPRAVSSDWCTGVLVGIEPLQILLSRLARAFNWLTHVLRDQ